MWPTSQPEFGDMEEEITSAVTTVGCSHTTIITRRGMLYVAGLNTNGELGLASNSTSQVRATLGGGVGSCVARCATQRRRPRKPPAAKSAPAWRLGCCATSC